MAENNLWSSQTLYAVSKKGAPRQWRCWVSVINGSPHIFTEFGVVGSANLITNSEEIFAGKNIGKKNETTAEQQAVLQAKALEVEKLKHKYALTLDAAEEIVYLPMLAKTFDPKKHNPIGMYAQPKLDGVRCFSIKIDGVVNLYSRNMRSYNHLLPFLKYFQINQPDNSIVDGELYCHDITFQKLIEIVKSEKVVHDDIDKVTFFAYDYVNLSNPTEAFSTRHLELNGFAESEWFDVVPTELVVGDYHELFARFIELGFEGMMLRVAESPYVFKYRSDFLLKVKEFMDEEFEIVDVNEGKGLSAGQAVLVCKTRDDKRFSVRCKGTNSYREWQLLNFQRLVNKPLTTRFFGFTDDGLPRFPVGIIIRDYE